MANQQAEATKRASLVKDQELQALNKISNLMAELPDEAVDRVMAYLNSRYEQAKAIREMLRAENLRK